MGRVERIIPIIEGLNIIETLGKGYSVNLEYLEEQTVNGNIVYKNIELDSILLNAEEVDNEIKLTKLVSLKAFLLSKEQGMDINNLIFNINRIMRLSNNDLALEEDSILYNEDLKVFFNTANIKVDKISEKELILNDGKRTASVKLNRNKVDFNTIKEIL